MLGVLWAKCDSERQSSIVTPALLNLSRVICSLPSVFRNVYLKKELKSYTSSVTVNKEVTSWECLERKVLICLEERREPKLYWFCPWGMKRSCIIVCYCEILAKQLCGVVPFSYSFTRDIGTDFTTVVNLMTCLSRGCYWTHVLCKPNTPLFTAALWHILVGVSKIYWRISAFLLLKWDILWCLKSWELRRTYEGKFPNVFFSLASVPTGIYPIHLWSCQSHHASYNIYSVLMIDMALPIGFSWKGGRRSHVQC